MSLLERLCQQGSTWVALRQQELSDRVHRDGDDFARSQGWTITTSTGRLGFGARQYRDPRFDRRKARLQPKGTSSRGVERLAAMQFVAGHRRN